MSRPAERHRSRAGRGWVVPLALMALVGCGEQTEPVPPGPGVDGLGGQEQPLPPGARPAVRDAPQDETRTSVVVKDYTVQGKRLHTRRSGPADGLPVLLLHGAKYSAATWHELGTLKYLSDAGVLAVAVDLPGHGSSEKMAIPPTQVLSTLLTTLQLRDPVVVSPSMSGRFVYPVLTKPKPPLRGWVAVAPVDARKMARKLTKLKLPTLIVWGTADRTVPIAEGRALAKSIRGARSLFIKGAGHAVYADDPTAFHQGLVEFLNTLKAPKAAAPRSSSP